MKSFHGRTKQNHILHTLKAWQQKIVVTGTGLASLPSCPWSIMWIHALELQWQKQKKMWGWKPTFFDLHRSHLRSMAGVCPYP